MFQFPSNGKARVNQPPFLHPIPMPKVSIPFKREGTCELCGCLQETRGLCPRFNSLQTGRHV